MRRWLVSCLIIAALLLAIGSCAGDQPQPTAAEESTAPAPIETESDTAGTQDQIVDSAVAPQVEEADIASATQQLEDTAAQTETLAEQPEDTAAQSDDASTEDVAEQTDNGAMAQTDADNQHVEPSAVSEENDAVSEEDTSAAEHTPHDNAEVVVVEVDPLDQIDYEISAAYQATASVDAVQASADDSTNADASDATSEQVTTAVPEDKVLLNNAAADGSSLTAEGSTTTHHAAAVATSTDGGSPVTLDTPDVDGTPDSSSSQDQPTFRTLPAVDPLAIIERLDRAFALRHGKPVRVVPLDGSENESVVWPRLTAEMAGKSLRFTSAPAESPRPEEAWAAYLSILLDTPQLALAVEAVCALGEMALQGEVSASREAQLDRVVPWLWTRLRIERGEWAGHNPVPWKALSSHPEGSAALDGTAGADNDRSTAPYWQARSGGGGGAEQRVSQGGVWSWQHGNHTGDGGGAGEQAVHAAPPLDLPAAEEPGWWEWYADAVMDLGRTWCPTWLVASLRSLDSWLTQWIGDDPLDSQLPRDNSGATTTTTSSSSTTTTTTATDDGSLSTDPLYPPLDSVERAHGMFRVGASLGHAHSNGMLGFLYSTGLARGGGGGTLVVDSSLRSGGTEDGGGGDVPDTHASTSNHQEDTQKPQTTGASSAGSGDSTSVISPTSHILGSLTRQADPAAGALHTYFGVMGGDLESHLHMGFRHLKGRDVPKSCSSSKQYYSTIAAEAVRVFEDKLLKNLNQAPEPQEISFGGQPDPGNGMDALLSSSQRNSLMQIMERQAAGGDPVSAVGLGKIHLWGWYGKNANFALARRYLEQAVALGSYEAVYLLSAMRAHGVGVEHDLDAAFAGFQSVADAYESDQATKSGPVAELQRIESALKRTREGIKSVREQLKRAGQGVSDKQQLSDVLLQNLKEDEQELLAKRKQLKKQVKLQNQQRNQGSNGHDRRAKKGRRRQSRGIILHSVESSSVSETLYAVVLKSLGYMYWKGIGVPRDIVQAFKLFKTSARHATTAAAYYLSAMYLNGEAASAVAAMAEENRGTTTSSGGSSSSSSSSSDPMERVRDPRKQTPDEASAVKYLSLSAATGHIPSMYGLARMFFMGQGAMRSCQLGVQLMKAVAETHMARHAMNRAYRAYEAGNFRYALMVYMRLAEGGVELAQYNAAMLLSRGLGYPHAAGEYRRLHRRRPPAALEGDDADDADSAETGQVVSDDVAHRHWLLHRYLKMGADAGRNECLRLLGDFYYGQGQYRPAFRHYTSAGKAGDVEALFDIGLMYSLGEGVKQDFLLAKRYFDQALSSAGSNSLPVHLGLWHLYARQYWYALKSAVKSAIGWE